MSNKSNLLILFLCFITLTTTTYAQSGFYFSQDTLTGEPIAYFQGPIIETPGTSMRMHLGGQGSQRFLFVIGKADEVDTLEASFELNIRFENSIASVIPNDIEYQDGRYGGVLFCCTYDVSDIIDKIHSELIFAVRIDLGLIFISDFVVPDKNVFDWKRAAVKLDNHLKE